MNKDYTLLIQNAEGGFDAYDGKTKLSENSVIKVVGNKNFTGEKLIKVTFLDESDARIMLNKASVKGVKAQTYTGKSIVLDMNKITVKVGGKTLIYGTDFTVSYVNNLNVGTATMIITAKEGSEFVGSKVVTFKINGVKISKAVAKLTVDGTEVGTKKGMEAAYTGSAIEPKVTLTLTDGTALTEGKDFTVTYKKNRKKGTAQVIITGKGGFTGTKNVKFKIKN